MSAVLVSVALAGVSGTVHAAATAVQRCKAFGFTGLTGSSGDVAIGRGQFFMEVSQRLAAGQATLQFRNVGAAPSSITGIFFEDRGKGGSADTQVLASFATFAASLGSGRPRRCRAADTALA